jgi:hypothetical protein
MHQTTSLYTLVWTYMGYIGFPPSNKIPSKLITIPYFSVYLKNEHIQNIVAIL